MIPVELITMAGGAAMGGLFKMIDKAQEAKKQQQEMMMNMMKAKTEQADAASERATKAADAAAARVGNDPFAKMTRRIFVLSMVGLGAWAMMGGLTGLDIVVPIEKETGFNLLGLIDTSGTTTEFVRLENAIVHFEWLKISILAAGSFYLGKS
jgi:hypothetical protein